MAVSIGNPVLCVKEILGINAGVELMLVVGEECFFMMD